MKKAFTAIVIGFIAFILVFAEIGGSFGRQFWLGFLPGLMENLAVLALAVLVINSIFREERLGKLKQTNASQSKFVLLLNDRLAYLLLEYLALATKDEARNDPKLNFEFARDRFRDADLATIFYNKLMETENREAFADRFARILSRETEGISKALDNIYPRPDPTIKEIVDQMMHSIGALEAFKALFGVFKAANARVSADEQLKPEHLDLLTKIAYEQIGSELQNIQRTIIRLSDEAKANKLFICLD